MMTITTNDKKRSTGGRLASFQGFFSCFGGSISILFRLSILQKRQRIIHATNTRQVRVRWEGWTRGDRAGERHDDMTNQRKRQREPISLFNVHPGERGFAFSFLPVCEICLVAAFRAERTGASSGEPRGLWEVEDIGNIERRMVMTCSFFASSWHRHWGLRIV
jgi:hypothetical protein